MCYIILHGSDNLACSIAYRMTSNVNVMENGMEGAKNKCAIVGVGETKYSRDSGGTELSPAVEAANRAIADAGRHVTLTIVPL